MRSSWQQGGEHLLAIIIATLLYGAAVWLWWQQRAPIYLFALAGGQLSALLTPFWRLIYSLQSVPAPGSVLAALTTPFDPIRSLGAAWPETLPALIVLVVTMMRWWTPNTLSGWFTYLVFVSVQLLFSLLGLREPAPPTLLGALPFGLSAELLAALMSATMTYGLCYVLITVQRYSWPSMAAAVIPMPLLLGGFVYGVIGAPLLIGRLPALSAQAGDWPAQLGLLLSVALLGWAVAIISAGLNRLYR